MIFGMKYTNFAMLLAMNVLDWYSFHLVYTHFFAFKEYFKKRKWIYVAALPVMYVVMTFCNIYFHNVVGNISSYFLCFLAMVFIFFDAKNPKGYAIMVFLFVGNALAEGISAVIARINFGISLDGYEIFDYPGSTLTSGVIKFLIVILICKFGTKDRDKKMNKVMCVFFLVPISSVFMFYISNLSLALLGDKEILWNLTIVAGILLLFSNVAVFYGMEKYTRIYHSSYELKEKALKAEADSDIMEVAAKSMKEQLSTMESYVERDRMMRHDRRHFEGLILSLINDGDYDRAKTLLEERVSAEPTKGRRWCNNTAVNATMDYYINKAEALDIKVTVEANIPTELKCNELDLAIAMGNLIENAIHACEKIDEASRFIKISAQYKSQLLLMIENSCNGQVVFDENGYPITGEAGHGVGTKSILAFINKTGSEVFYSLDNLIFKVKMIINA